MVLPEQATRHLRQPGRQRYLSEEMVHKARRMGGR